LNQTAINIHNHIRAFNFREYQTPIVNNELIISSKILSKKSILKSGVVVCSDEKSITISSIDYDVILYKDKRDNFLSACANNDIKTVSNLLEIPNILNIQNDKGWTPLIVSAYNSNVEIFNMLLKSGANPSIKGFNGTTLLMYAKDGFIGSNNSTILDIVLSLNGNIYENDYKGLNVIDYCRMNKQENALKHILGE
jgi:methionyl-tRNA formyltransferase